MKKYFSYSYDNCFVVHDTEEQARAAAMKDLDVEREYARSEGWGECVDEIRWGEIKQAAVQKECGWQVEIDGEMVDAVDWVLENIGAV